MKSGKLFYLFASYVFSPDPFSEKIEICFNFFICDLTGEAAGGVVCRKFKLKNFFNLNYAGGCGAALILSRGYLFCYAVAQQATTWCCDLFWLFTGMH